MRLLEERRPGILARANLTLMGGCVYPPRAGYPAWGAEMDWNVQSDKVEIDNGWLVERPHPQGQPFQVVTRIDGPVFSEAWVGWVAGQ